MSFFSTMRQIGSAERVEETVKKFKETYSEQPDLSVIISADSKKAECPLQVKYGVMQWTGTLEQFSKSDGVVATINKAAWPHFQAKDEDGIGISDLANTIMVRVSATQASNDLPIAVDASILGLGQSDIADCHTGKPLQLVLPPNSVSMNLDREIFKTQDTEITEFSARLISHTMESLDAMKLGETTSVHVMPPSADGTPGARVVIPKWIAQRDSLMGEAFLQNQNDYAMKMRARYGPDVNVNMDHGDLVICAAEFANDYMKIVKEEKAGVEVVPFNLFNCKAAISPIGQEWKHVPDDARVGHPLFPDTKDVAMSKVYTVQVCYRFEFHLPEAVGLTQS